MADNTLGLLFTADTKALDTAKDKLADLGDGLPTTGNLIKGLGQQFTSLPGPIGLGVAALTAFGVAAAALGEKAASSIDSLMEMSSATGVSVQNLQVMKTAMGLTGASTEGLEQMLGHLNRTIDEAQDPTTKAAVAMNMLGVSQSELAKGDTAEIMKHVAKSLSEMAPGANKAALEMAIFGKSGAEADEAIKSLNENTDRAKQILADHGAVTADDIEAQKGLNAALTEAKAVFEGLGLSVLREVVPAITSAVQWFDNVTKTSGPLISSLKQAWDTTKQLASAFMEAVKPIVDVAMAIGQQVMAFDKFTASGTLVQNVIANLKEAWADFVVLLKVVVIAFYGAEEVVMTLAEGLVRLGNALTDIGQGHLKQAAHEFDGFTDSIKKNIQSVKDFAESQFTDQLDEVVVTAKKIPPAVDEGTKSVGSLAAAMKQIAEQRIVDDLNLKWADQRKILTAAIKGLDDYKTAQNEVAIGSELLKMQQAGASAQQLKDAEAALRGASAAKDATQQQVSGLRTLAQLQEQVNQLKNGETIVDKANAAISLDPKMTEALKQKILAEAQEAQALQESIDVKKMLLALDQQVTKDTTAQVATMTLSAQELKVYNEQLKLKQQYEKDMAATKDLNVQKQLTAEYEKDNKLIQEQNQQVQQLQESWQGFGMGAVQAIQNAANAAKNLYAIGGQLVTQINNDLANAFVKAMQGGKDAFQQLIASIGQMIAQQIMKFAITQAELGILAAFGITGPAAATLLGAAPTKNAKGNAFSGGSVEAFADGGVVSGPTYFNMGVMGEAGPEAIMPLQRDSQGRLGVTMNGSGSSSSGGDVHFHAPAITINSNQDPHEVAKQVRKQLKVHQALVRSEIAKQQRPGGMLHNRAPMLS